MLIQLHAYHFYVLYVCYCFCFYWCCFCWCGYCWWLLLSAARHFFLLFFCPSMYLRIDNLMLYEKKGKRIKNDGSAIIMFFFLSSFFRLLVLLPLLDSLWMRIGVLAHTHTHHIFFSFRFLFLSIDCSFCIDSCVAFLCYWYARETKHKIELFGEFMHTDYLYFVFRFKINAHRFFDSNEFVW